MGAVSTNQIVSLAVVFACAVGLACCGGGGGGGGNLPTSVTFVVLNGAGLPVIGATVYLVPAGAVDGSPITGQDVLAGSSEDRDEPLEDAVRLNGATFPQGLTSSMGIAVVTGVAQGTYFWFVSPGLADQEHLPGGSGCRSARQTDVFLGTTQTIVLSGQPTQGALHVGSTTCLQCHPTFGSFGEHAHKLSLSVPGQFSPNQDPVRYPGIQDNWNLFLPAAVFSLGTQVFFSDFNTAGGFDKFKTSLTNPAPGMLTGTVTTVADGAASGGFTAGSANGSGNQFSSGATAIGSVTVCITTPSAGDYQIDTTVVSPSGSDNSFWVRVNNDGPWLYDTATSPTPTNDQVNDRGLQDPVIVTLAAGDNQITFEVREDGTRLDTITLTPTGP